MIHEDFWGACTTYNDLPDGYDDCWTAQWLDDGEIVMSFGSFSPYSIQANEIYYGSWTFSDRGPLSSTDIQLFGQEGAWEVPNPAFVGSFRSEELITEHTWTYGSRQCRAYGNEAWCE